MRAGFLVNEVYSGLRRNVTMTIAMILTTAISIGLFGGGLLVIQLAKQSRNIYLDRVESQVFLNNDVSANDPTCDADACKALRAQIEARDDVKSVRFLNRDDAYTDAITKFPEYKDVASKDSFPASFIVKLNNPEQHKGFDAAMGGQPGVLNVLNQKEFFWILTLFLSERGLRALFKSASVIPPCFFTLSMIAQNALSTLSILSGLNGKFTEIRHRGLGIFLRLPLTPPP